MKDSNHLLAGHLGPLKLKAFFRTELFEWIFNFVLNLKVNAFKTAQNIFLIRFTIPFVFKTLYMLDHCFIAVRVFDLAAWLELSFQIGGLFRNDFVSIQILLPSLTVMIILLLLPFLCDRLIHAPMAHTVF